MPIDISVIIPTYNPDFERLTRTLKGLRSQTLLLDDWELIIINNNSSHPVRFDIDWHHNATVIEESRQGLTYARLKGFLAAKGDIVLLVDDDNVLAENYLDVVKEIFLRWHNLGAAGGKSIPLFETEPPEWLKTFHGNLALRDLGDEILMNDWENQYPYFAPLGAGMAVRKSALTSYIEKIQTRKHIITDRNGGSLSSGGDNDISLEVLKSGWSVGYFPALKLEHIIPGERMKVSYLARLNNDTSKSWILLLESHGINPWKKITPWSVPFRKFKSWFKYRVWRNEIQYILWRGACGTYDGLAAKQLRKKTFKCQ